MCFIDNNIVVRFIHSDRNVQTQNAKIPLTSEIFIDTNFELN